MFTRNVQSAACCVLRALNNRKYIFFVSLTLEHAKLKAVDEKKKVKMRKNIISFLLNTILQFYSGIIYRTNFARILIGWKILGQLFVSG